MPEKKPTRLPIALSALVYPGCGQALQGRWLAAVLVAGMFTPALGCFLFGAVRILHVYYTLAVSFGEPGEVSVPSVAGMFVALGVCFVVYIIGIIDTFFAHQRSCSEWSARRHGLSLVDEDVW